MKLNAANTFFFSVIALAAMTGCGGSSSSGGETATTDAGGKTDSGTLDSGVKPDGAAGGSIAGSLAITVTVLQNQMGILGDNMPFNLAGARIELPGSAAKCLPAYCIEAKTDATGVVTFNVDPSQGPYDITIANTGFGAVSILGVSAPVPDSVILYPLGGTPAYQTFNATGTIDGGANPTDTYQLDSWDWNTVVQTGSTYTTTFQVTPGVSTPLPVAAMDALADGGTIVNGYLAAVNNTRTAADEVINIDFPSTPIPADLAVVNITWPSSGFNAGSNVHSIGNLAAGETETYLGNGFIEQTIASEPGAAMFVGSVVVSVPTGTTSTATIQSYSTGANANLKPDIVEALLSSQAAGATTVSATDFNTIVELHYPIASGATVTVPAVRNFAFTNTTTLDTLQFAADSDYASTQISISDTSAGATTVIWTIYAQGGTVATRGLPRLPTSLGGATELSGDVSMLGAAISGTTYVTGALSPWFISGNESNISFETTTIVNAVAPTVGTY